VPQTRSTWPKNEIDRFVLAGLQKSKLSPSPEAPKLRWLGVSVDLTVFLPCAGLPRFTARQRGNARIEGRRSTDLLASGVSALPAGANVWTSAVRRGRTGSISFFGPGAPWSAALEIEKRGAARTTRACRIGPLLDPLRDGVPLSLRLATSNYRAEASGSLCPVDPLDHPCLCFGPYRQRSGTCRFDCERPWARSRRMPRHSSLGVGAVTLKALSERIGQNLFGEV